MGTAKPWLSLGFAVQDAEHGYVTREAKFIAPDADWLFGRLKAKCNPTLMLKF